MIMRGSRQRRHLLQLFYVGAPAPLVQSSVPLSCAALRMRGGLPRENMNRGETAILVTPRGPVALPRCFEYIPVERRSRDRKA